jgi:hypothetical protein
VSSLPTLPPLAPYEIAQVNANAAAAPPAPTFLPSAAGIDVPTVYLSYASYVYSAGSIITGIYVESALSPSALMPDNAHRTVVSPPAPTGGAQAFGYNVYSNSNTTGQLLQNANPIPLGTNFTIQSNAAQAAGGRGLPSAPMLALTMIPTSGSVIRGLDGYSALASGTQSTVQGMPVGQGLAATHAILTGFSAAPAGVIIVAAAVKWTAAWHAQPCRLGGPNIDPCTNPGMVGSDPRLNVTAGSTTLSPAFIAGENAVNIAYGLIPLLQLDLYVEQEHSTPPKFCGADGPINGDNISASGFRVELAYHLVDALVPGVIFPLPPPPTQLLPYMIIPGGASQSINELEGQSSVGSLEVDCIDVRGELKRVMADPHALGTAVLFEVGFEGECLGDFVTLHTMQITDIGWSPEGLVQFQAADVQRALFDQVWLMGGPYQFWQADVNYQVGDQIIDVNGNIQEAVQPGASGFYEPVWESSAGSLTYDGSILNRWQARTNYLANAVIRDSAGNVQTSQGGTTGEGEPIWLERPGAATRDGIEGHYFYWTNGGPQLTWRNRGALQPGGPCFTPNEQYASSQNPRWVQGNPIDILLVAYQNEIGLGQTSEAWQIYDPISGTGLINPNPAIDVLALLELKRTQFSGDRFEFKFTGATTAKDWVEDQILKPLGLYHIVRPSGQLSFKSMKSPLSAAAVARLDQDNIMGIPQLARWPVLNFVSVRFDSEDTALKGASNSSEYNAEYSFVDTESVDQFGQYLKQQAEASGMRLAWGGYTRAWLLAQRIFARHAFGTPEYSINAFLSTLELELGDLVLVSHPLVPDLKNPNGALGLVDVLCEITDKQPNYASGTLQYKAADTRFMHYTKPYLIVPASAGVPAWTSATPDQKAKYFFVAGSSGAMSDGAAAATIF